MSGPLRLQSLALPVGDPAPVEQLYRWALQMKPAPDDEPAGVTALGWGREDRVRLLAAPAVDDPVEAVTLRMEARPLDGVVEWLTERGLEPVAAATAPEDVEAARAAWPGAGIEAIGDEAAANVTQVILEGPGPPRVELAFPLPKEILGPRNRVGPFYRRSADWSGLEVPGLLGVTTGAPDRAAAIGFLATLGIAGMGSGEGAPLGIGEHQWIVEEREPAGIYGFAIVVGVSRIRDLQRTLEHLGADHRHDGNRLLAADPAGRVVLVHGVRGA